jgi:hypothetical protein
MCFVSICENRRMKRVEIVLRKGRRGRGSMTEGVNLRYTVSIYVNITIIPLYNYYILIKS